MKRDGVQDLDKICARIGHPATIRFDQGTELVSRDLDPVGPVGLHQRRDMGSSRPGKPTDNAFIEAFNGRFRAQSPKCPQVQEP